MKSAWITAVLLFFAMIVVSWPSFLAKGYVTDVEAGRQPEHIGGRIEFNSPTAQMTLWPDGELTINGTRVEKLYNFEIRKAIQELAKSIRHNESLLIKDRVIENLTHALEEAREALDQCVRGCYCRPATCSDYPGGPSYPPESSGPPATGP